MRPPPGDRLTMRYTRFLASGAVLGALALAGCQDLAVENPNEPDRGRATQQPLSVESFVSSAFRTWWPSVHDDYPIWALSTMADEVTSGFADFGQMEDRKSTRLNSSHVKISYAVF